MAIYQYYLVVVPKEGILKIHDLIPTQIGVCTEAGYFEYDAELYWKKIDKKAEEIIPKIDSIVKRADWGNSSSSFNWKTYTETLDNDAFMGLDEETFSITEFSFRTDLRENGFTFLKNMIELGKENDWMFMDRKGKLMNADFEEIKESIRNSDANRFFKDPIKFLESLDSENE